MLNRAFLIFPQHALADGMIEICKNYIQSELFKRYYIDTYKSPVRSALLRPHIISLLTMGIVCLFLNYLIESGCVQKIYQRFSTKKEKHNNDLQIVSIQNTMQKGSGKLDQYTQNCVLNVQSLTKSYNSKRQKAVDNVSFNTSVGECFGLLGTNGAGKSTIFSILSGQLQQTSGSVEFYQNNGISYCPQNNPLDPLLTVEEVIVFYSRLKNTRSTKEVCNYIYIGSILKIRLCKTELNFYFVLFMR